MSSSNASIVQRISIKAEALLYVVVTEPRRLQSDMRYGGNLSYAAGAGIAPASARRRLTGSTTPVSPSSVRALFAVGAGLSRTWVFTRAHGKMQLKHDYVD